MSSTRTRAQRGYSSYHHLEMAIVQIPSPKRIHKSEFQQDSNVSAINIREHTRFLINCIALGVLRIKTSASMSTTNILLSLPKEMIAMEILSRLPVKYIIRFRSVCKTFLSSFSDLDRDEAFVKLHLHNAVKNNYLNIMLTGGNNQIYSVDYFDASSSSCKIKDAVLEVDHPFKSGTTGGVRIWGSCNGLVCLGISSNGYGDDCLCLWNPSTTEYKRIPPPPSPGYGDHWYESYGFGYDCASDDYKLVRILFEPETYDTEAQVYALGTNSWKRIGDVPFDFPLYEQPGIYLDGCLHWEPGQGQVGRAVDSFCLNDEKFKELPLPTDFDYDLAKELSVLKGCLCLVGTYPACRTDVWVMTEYGVTESWTKTYTMNHDTIGHYICTKRILMPYNNGEILVRLVDNGGGVEVDDHLEEVSCFVLYSPDKGITGDTNIMTIRKGILPTVFEASTCLETFVSLKSGTYWRGNHNLAVPVMRQRRTQAEDEYEYTPPSIRSGRRPCLS